MSRQQHSRRARRLASDEAHAWARNIKLGNPLAKLVLIMLTGYVNAEGVCWVGLAQIAEDCDLGVNTVRDRLSWLETVGVIARRACWVDPSGVRNTQARGRRTTDDIQLMWEDGGEGKIEAGISPPRRGGSAEETDAVSPPQGGGSAETVSPPPHGGQDSAGATPALRRPSDSVEGLTPEPEPEPESPQGPRGGEGEAEQEPEDFQPAWLSWPGHEVMRRDLALEEFRLLTPEKQRLCRAAIPLYLAKLKHMKRDHVRDFHLWIRSRGFDEFPTATLEQAGSPPTPNSYDVSSAEGKAILNLHRFCRTSVFENRGSVIYSLPITAGLLAFTEPPAYADWVWVDATQREQVGAWSRFVKAHILRPAQLVEQRGIGADAKHGFKAPWPWPPLKNGTISTTGNDDQEQGAA